MPETSNGFSSLRKASISVVLHGWEDVFPLSLEISLPALQPQKESLCILTCARAPLTSLLCHIIRSACASCPHLSSNLYTSPTLSKNVQVELPLGEDLLDNCPCVSPSRLTPHALGHRFTLFSPLLFGYTIPGMACLLIFFAPVRPWISTRDREILLRRHIIMYGIYCMIITWYKISGSQSFGYINSAC